METHPITYKECYDIMRAAHRWAWQHKVRVKTKYHKHPENKYSIKVTLTHKYRVRDFS